MTYEKCKILTSYESADHTAYDPPKNCEDEFIYLHVGLVSPQS